MLGAVGVAYGLGWWHQATAPSGGAILVASDEQRARATEAPEAV